MIFLVDTNVLLRLIQQSHAMHADARRAATTLTRQGNQLSIIAQNLIEFWAVATRPTVNNGLALSIADTVAHIKTFAHEGRLQNPESSGLSSRPIHRPCRKGY